MSIPTILPLHRNESWRTIGHCNCRQQCTIPGHRITQDQLDNQLDARLAQVDIDNRERLTATVDAAAERIDMMVDQRILLLQPALPQQG